MGCKKIKILLSAYVDKELSSDEKQLVDEHLKTCADCSAELKYLEQTKKMFSLWQKVEPQPFFETRLFSRIKETTVPLLAEEFVKVTRKLAPLFCGVLLLTIGLWAVDSLVTSKNYTVENYLTENIFDSTEQKVLFGEEISKADLVSWAIYDG